MKGTNEGRNSFPLITFVNMGLIFRSGQMDELHLFLCESTQNRQDSFVDAMGSLASTHHQHGLQAALQAQILEGLDAVNRTPQTVANWGTGYFDNFTREIACALLETEQDFLRKERIQQIGFTRNRV